MHDQPRVILALTAERQDDEFVWNRIRTLEAEIFSAPVSVKFAYFGAEGAGQTRRPCISSNWITDVDDWRDIVDRGQANCVCGCFLRTGDVLEQALHETRQAPVRAVVIIGDRFHGDLDAAVAIAKQLRAAGTRVFLLQQGRSRSTEHAFRMLAEATGGTYHQFNPHVERIAERLPKMMAAITDYAVGGKAALEARDDEFANLLLEQMATADRMLAHSR